MQGIKCRHRGCMQFQKGIDLSLLLKKLEPQDTFNKVLIFCHYLSAKMPGWRSISNRAIFYALNPNSSQERNNPNPFFKKKKFGLYQYGQPVQKRTESSNYQKRASVARRFSEKRSLCQKPKGFSHRDVESYLYRKSTSIQGASIRMPFSAQKEEEFA